MQNVKWFSSLIPPLNIREAPFEVVLTEAAVAATITAKRHSKHTHECKTMVRTSVSKEKKLLDSSSLFAYTHTNRRNSRAWNEPDELLYSQNSPAAIQSVDTNRSPIILLQVFNSHSKYNALSENEWRENSKQYRRKSINRSTFRLVFFFSNRRTEIHSHTEHQSLITNGMIC